MIQAKKPSLFKQKIAEARSKMQVKENGFPIAPCIITEKKVEQQQTLPTNEQSNQASIHHQSFLSNFKGDKHVKPEQISKIQSQNLQKIKNMSENERLELITTLKSQLPQAFITRLNIKKEETKPILESLIFDKLQQQKKNQQDEREEQSYEQSWKQLLKLNVQTQGLQYTSKSDEKYVNIQKLTLLVGSQNNHSQLVGGKLIALWAKAISSYLTTKTRELLKISGVTIHGGHLGEKIATISDLCLKQIKNTTYTSIFIELCTSVSQAIIHIASLLSNSTKKNVSQSLNAIVQKIKARKAVNLSAAQSAQITHSIEAVKQLMKEPEDQDLKCSQWINSIDQIIELSLLQEQGYNGYWHKAFCAAEKCSDLEQLTELLEFVYQFINKLIIKRNRQLYINIKIHRDRWAPAIDHIVLKLVKSCWKIPAENMLKSVFLSRFLGGLSWQAVSQTTQLPGQKGQLICGFLLFNAFSDLKAKNITEQQINLLNMTMDWLAEALGHKNKGKLHPTYILQTLLQLFLIQEEYYSLLNQQILEKLLKVCLNHPKISVEQVVTISKAKTLSQSYCFNSFGSNSFTYLMFLVAIKGSTQCQGLIIKELMTPYWKFFYLLGTFTDLRDIRTQSRENSILKEQLLKKLKQEDIELNNNGFVSYLL